MMEREHVIRISIGLTTHVHSSDVSIGRVDNNTKKKKKNRRAIRFALMLSPKPLGLG